MLYLFHLFPSFLSEMMLNRPRTRHRAASSLRHGVVSSGVQVQL